MSLPATPPSRPRPWWGDLYGLAALGGAALAAPAASLAAPGATSPNAPTQVVQAAPLAPMAGSSAAEPLELDLPAGPLALGLSRLAAQAGLSFAVDERLVAGLQQPGLHGRLTPAQAFAHLLQGTGLALVREGPLYTLQRLAAAPDRLDGADRPAPAPDTRQASSPPAGSPSYLAPEAVLPEVRVIARAEADPQAYRHPLVQQATRTETAQRDLPQSVSVLSAALIRDLAPQSLSELLRHVPGLVAAQGEGNRDTLVFRGSLSTSDFLLDGLRDDVQYYRDLYNIERIEALRGPNAATIGHGAVGGLVNRISKQAEPGAFTRLGLETGSQAHARLTLDSNQPLGPALNGRLNLMLEDSASHRQYYGLRRAGLNPVLAWRLAPAAWLSLGFEHFQDTRTADRGQPSYQGRPIAASPAQFFGNPEASRTWIRLNALNAQLDLDLGAGLALQAKTRLADHDKFFQNVFPGPVRDGAQGQGQEVALLAHNSQVRRRNAFQQLDLSGQAQTGDIQHQWLVGLELGHQQGSNRRLTGYFSTTPESTVLWLPLAQPVSWLPLQFKPRAGDPDNAVRTRVLALHVQDQMRLSPQWLATLALRHDHVQTDVDDHAQGQHLASRDRLWSPRAGLVWQPASDWSAYANLSLGYALRAGEQFTLLSPNNQQLRPERFTNRELGLKWQPRPSLDAHLSLYQLDRANVALSDPQAPDQTPLLVDGQRTRGLEFSLGGTWRPGWQVQAAYTLQRSHLRHAMGPNVAAGARSPHVPRHNLSLWNRWALDTRWALGLGLGARSSLYASADNRVRLPGYARWDAALYYAPHPGLRWQLNLDNLLNRRYSAYAHNNNNISPGAPLTARLALHLNY